MNKIRPQVALKEKKSTYIGMGFQSAVESNVTFIINFFLFKTDVFWNSI